MGRLASGGMVGLALGTESKQGVQDPESSSKSKEIGWLVIYLRVIGWSKSGAEELALGLAAGRSQAAV